jgi:hypothetical protein
MGENMKNHVGQIWENATSYELMREVTVVKQGETLFKIGGHCNIVLVLRVERSTATVLYLDNVNPVYIGSIHELETDYVKRTYASGGF